MSELETPPSFLNPAEQAPKPPASGYWLFYLFFRPRRFFSHFDHLVTRFTLVYAAWVFGMAEVIARFRMEVLKQQLSGDSRPSLEALNLWPIYWTAVLFFGAIGGLLLYAIGGWWYRVRIGFSGAVKPNKALARRTYIFASLVVALPSVILTVVDSFTYPTPLAAEEADRWWWLVLIECLFWSVWCSYRGVRTLFAVGVWRARVWFLILPSLVYGLVFGGLAVSSLALVPPTPDLEHPKQIDRGRFSFSYPGNWRIEVLKPRADYHVRVGGAEGAGAHFVILAKRDSPSRKDSLHESFLQHYRTIFPGGAPSDFTRWGPHTGVGAEYEGRNKDNHQRYRVRVFSMSTSSHSMTVVEFAHVQVVQEAEPAFELIRSTFKLKDR